MVMAMVKVALALVKYWVHPLQGSLVDYHNRQVVVISFLTTRMVVVVEVAARIDMGTAMDMDMGTVLESPNHPLAPFSIVGSQMRQTRMRKIQDRITMV